MKTIAIVAYLKGFGGTERSLLDFVNGLDKSKYEITIILLSKPGEIINELSDGVTIIERSSRLTYKEIVFEMIKSRKILGAWRYLLSRLARKHSKRLKFAWYQFDAQNAKKIGKEFDCAICWALPDSFEVVYTATQIHARSKYLWIHMDLNHYLAPIDAQTIYSLFDKIVCVSEACLTSFVSNFPGLKSKAYRCYNILDENRILLLANDSNPFSNNYFNIVTCGRLSKEKRPLYAVAIGKELLNRGIDCFRWYFIGDGLLFDTFKKSLKENGLDKHIILLGIQQNPYPYIKYADLYVQMSRHESFCLALAEAQLLNVPCITTPFPSAYEIIDSGITGLIVEDSTEAMTASISSLIKDRQTLCEIKNNIESIDRREYLGSITAFECLLEDH